MIKLIRTNILHLTRYRLFWICVASLVGFGVILPVMSYMNMLHYGKISTLEDNVFNISIIISIIAPIFCSLFLGTQYSDGTIRNKIVAQHKRSHIYIANLSVCCVSMLLMLLAYFLAAFVIGLPLLGLGIETGSFIILVIITFMMAFALCAIFTFVAVLCQNKAVSAIICILLAFTLLFIGDKIHSRLEEPEVFNNYIVMINGKPQMVEIFENPTYLRGTEREVYSFLHDLLPGGQVAQISDVMVERPRNLFISSLSIIIISAACGIAMFRRKGIK